MSNSQGNKKFDIPPILQAGRKKSTRGHGHIEKPHRDRSSLPLILQAGRQNNRRGHSYVEQQFRDRSSIPPILQAGRQNGSRGHGTLDPKDLRQGLLLLPDNAIFREKHLQKTLELSAPDFLEKLQPWMLNTLHTPIPNCQNDDNAIWVLLLTWFDIFNTAFFGGGLQQVRDRIYLLHKGGTTSVVARYTSPQIGETAGKIEIDVDYFPPDLGDGITIEQHYIGSLLHEMLHGFIFIHRCTCHLCEAEWPASTGGSGTTYHGPVFLDSLLAIGEALQDQVNWQVDVGIGASFASEVADGKWDPTPEQRIKYKEPPEAAPNWVELARARRKEQVSKGQRDGWRAATAIEQEVRSHSNSYTQDEQQENALQRHKTAQEKQNAKAIRRHHLGEMDLNKEEIVSASNQTLIPPKSKYSSTKKTTMDIDEQRAADKLRAQQLEQSNWRWAHEESQAANEALIRGRIDEDDELFM